MNTDRLNSFLRFWPLFLGVACAYLATGLIPQSPVLRTGGSPLSDVKAVVEETEQDLIMEKNILGLAVPVREVQPTSGDPSSWVLGGIIAGSNPMALVHIEGKPVVLSLGQSHQGWELVEVAPDTVVFSHGRTDRTLKLFDKDKPAGTAAPKTASGGPSRPSSGGGVQIARSSIADVLQDPNRILQQALFKPYEEGGSVRGFKVTNIEKGSLLESIGLRNGDILVRINGEVIDGPAKMIQLYSGLQNAEFVKLDISRDGSMRPLLVELK